MKKFSINKLQNVFLFLYLFFLSFLNFTPFYLISAILLICITFLKIIRNRKIILTKYFYFELFFIVYNVIYYILGWSINAEHTLNAIRTLILNLSINLAIMNSIEKKEDIIEILKWFIPIAVFSCIFVILYTGGKGSNGRLAHGYPRPFDDTSYTSMEFASWALYAGVFALFSSFKKEGKNKYIIPMIIYWVVIIWSGSRKCIVFGIILQLSVYLFCKGNKKNLKIFLKKAFMILVVLCISVVVIMKNSTIYNIVGYRFIGYLNKTESSAVTRDDMKKTAISYIKLKPIKGYGLNTFRDISKYKTWSESNYLELAFGNGIFITIIYYIFLIYIIISLMKNYENDKINIIFAIILIMIILFDSVSMSYQGRLETFLITISSMILYFDKMKKNNGEQ